MSDLRERVWDIINVSCDTPCGKGEYCGCLRDADAAIALIRAEVLEEAARVADWPYPASEGWGEEMAGRIAAAEDIRALKEKTG